ncbi:MAG: hypothetical protein ABGW69_02430 [Nanoarchaeota archaeon]
MEKFKFVIDKPTGIIVAKGKKSYIFTFEGYGDIEIKKELIDDFIKKFEAALNYLKRIKEEN